MTYLLDTSIIIELLRDKEISWEFITNHSEDQFITSTICEAEIYEGVYREKDAEIPNKKKALQNVLSKFSETIEFDSEQGEVAGEIRADLSKAGQLVGDIDVLIAAAAKVSNATIWTKNPKHFKRIKNLEVLPL